MSGAKKIDFGWISLCVSVGFPSDAPFSSYTQVKWVENSFTLNCKLYIGYSCLLLSACWDRLSLNIKNKFRKMDESLDDIKWFS